MTVVEKTHEGWVNSDGGRPGIRYFLDDDGDGHWYLIPEGMREQWEEFVKAIEAYWENRNWKENKAEPEEPLGVISLGCAPNGITFTDPRYGKQNG